VSSDHRQRQIDKGSVSRSRDRWRPPDQKRERRPAGTDAADLKNMGNSNTPANGTPRFALQARRASEAWRLFRQRAVARVDALGSRPTFELVDEIIRHHPDLEDEIDKRIDKYADLDPDLLKYLGADRFPPVPPPRLVGVRQ
jgi:hypothetical protein